MYVEQKLKVLYSTEKPLRRKREGKISREKLKLIMSGVSGGRGCETKDWQVVTISMHFKSSIKRKNNAA